jgi:hypothetical protein
MADLNKEIEEETEEQQRKYLVSVIRFEEKFWEDSLPILGLTNAWVTTSSLKGIAYSIAITKPSLEEFIDIRIFTGKGNTTRGLDFRERDQYYKYLQENIKKQVKWVEDHIEERPKRQSPKFIQNQESLKKAQKYWKKLDDKTMEQRRKNVKDSRKEN